MNRITRFVNDINKALDPLSELVKDENFRGEVLAAVKLKESPDPAKKAETQKKLTGIKKFLDDFRKKLGLDSSDIPKVNNIVALAAILAELVVVIKALKDLLETCDVIGDNNSASDGDKETVVRNAINSIARFLAQAAIRRTNPPLAAIAEATGILFSTELNETRRALDLLLYPVIDWLASDNKANALSPIGDVKDDDHFRKTKSLFLWLTIIAMIVEKKIFEGKENPLGRFLFSMGYELKKDPLFPNAAKIADRVLQMQFIPGRLLSMEEEQAYPEKFSNSQGIDAVLSLATIPVPKAGALPGQEPAGYQYLLGIDLNHKPLGDDIGEITIECPKKLKGYFVWGHNTSFGALGADRTIILSGTDPLIRIRYKSLKNEEEGTEDVEGGEIVFEIIPGIKKVKGKEESDAELKLTFNNFSLSISGEGRDGFIQKILPENGAAKINLSFSIVYSLLLNKWTIEGLDKNDALLLLFSIDKKLFGKIEIPTLYVGLMPSSDEDGKLHGVILEASALLKAVFGPFQMTVDRLGLSLGINAPKDSNANLGFVDLDPGLKPPTGIGFLVDATTVKGGGFLSIDPANHQYYGAGELTIRLEKFNLSLKVVAIILTQLPDGKKGFSFLLLASIEFDPGITTAFGFKIKGVGVLVTLHRSMNLEEFQRAVNDDRFNSILFPDNPVANASTIVKSLNSLFPPVQGRYVFAIMARIAWGTTKLVDLKLGLLIEVPSPVKLAIVGVLKITIEKKINGKDAIILNLQINFLIALDLGKKMFSIDAAIYNSKLLMFDIRGQMFLRFSWGDNKVFLVSVGGWHPDFVPPAGLNLPAKPQRVSIPLLQRENLTLTVSCYFAFTSNTVQAGFAIDFKMKWSRFRLEAGLSVDALFHFDPFYFIVDFEGKLRIFWGDSTLAGVTVRGEFSGTNPWRIKGSATFEIWIWDYDVDFDKSWGEELQDITQEVDVLPLLQKAIEDKGNWQAILPADKATHVVLRKTSEDFDKDSVEDDAPRPIIADPLSQLDVVQKITPLGIRIDKLGFQKVKGARLFDLIAETADGDDLASTDLEEHFAAAMFLELEDAEKISRKSFEPMKAGRSFSDTESVEAGPAQISKCDYDNAFHDPLAPAPETKTEIPRFSTEVFQRWMKNSSIAKSSEGRKATARREIKDRKKMSRPDKFVLADGLTGGKIETVSGQKSMAGAYYEVWKLKKENPGRVIRVVKESELIS